MIAPFGLLSYLITGGGEEKADRSWNEISSDVLKHGGVEVNSSKGDVCLEVTSQGEKHCGHCVVEEINT